MTDAPLVQQVGGAIIVQGDCLQHLLAAVLALMREMHANGFAHPPALADLLIKAHAARTTHRARDMSANGHELATYVVAESHSEGQDVDDWIDVAEAAKLLRIGHRQMRRLAPSLSPGQARRIGRAWALKRAPVLALAEQRRRRE